MPEASSLRRYPSQLSALARIDSFYSQRLFGLEDELQALGVY